MEEIPVHVELLAGFLAAQLDGVKQVDVNLSKDGFRVWIQRWRTGRIWVGATTMQDRKAVELPADFSAAELANVVHTLLAWMADAHRHPFTCTLKNE